MDGAQYASQHTKHHPGCCAALGKLASLLVFVQVLGDDGRKRCAVGLWARKLMLFQ